MASVFVRKQLGAIIYGQRPFRCQGINIVTTDEGARVFIRNRKGVEFDVVVDEVVSSQEFTAHTAELLEAGDYWVVIETRGGNPDGTIRADDKPVKYLKVVDPPTKATLRFYPTATVTVERTTDTEDVAHIALLFCVPMYADVFGTLTLENDAIRGEVPVVPKRRVGRVGRAGRMASPNASLAKPSAFAGLVGYLVSDRARTGKMPVPHNQAPTARSGGGSTG